MFNGVEWIVYEADLILVDLNHYMHIYIHTRTLPVNWQTVSVSSHLIKYKYAV